LFFASPGKRFFTVFLESKDFLLWQQHDHSNCRYISHFSQGASASLLELHPLPSCRGAFHDPDEVVFLTKYLHLNYWWNNAKYIIVIVL